MRFRFLVSMLEFEPAEQMLPNVFRKEPDGRCLRHGQGRGLSVTQELTCSTVAVEVFIIPLTSSPTFLSCTATAAAG